MEIKVSEGVKNYDWKIFFTINIANLNMLISNDRIKAAAKNLKKTFVAW